MKKLTYYIILTCLSFSSYGQKFEVPDSILNGVESRQFEYTYLAKFNYKIVYPINYDSLTSYKVLIGLSGGNANEQIVNYCYYTLFDSKYFENYITILPLGPSGRPLSEMDSSEINLLIADIVKNQKVTNHNWISLNNSTKSKLEGNVKSIEVFTIEGQGHIISPDYDIDKVYSKYFITNN